jgi:hypothetical protein
MERKTGVTPAPWDTSTWPTGEVGRVPPARDETVAFFDTGVPPGSLTK